MPRPAKAQDGLRVGPRLTTVDRCHQQAELQKRGVQSSIPIDVLVTPVKPTYYNMQGNALDFMTFYAPGVLALILQLDLAGFNSLYVSF